MGLKVGDFKMRTFFSLVRQIQHECFADAIFEWNLRSVAAIGHAVERCIEVSAGMQIGADVQHVVVLQRDFQKRPADDAK